jgi:hypothetical protein
MDPLSRVPLTTPRRFSATRPAAIGPTIGATTVARPMRAFAAMRSGKAGAALAASSNSPVRPSNVTMSRRCGSRSPSGTSKKIPAA